MLQFFPLYLIVEKLCHFCYCSYSCFFLVILSCIYPIVLVPFIYNITRILRLNSRWKLIRRDPVFSWDFFEIILRRFPFMYSFSVFTWNAFFQVLIPTWYIRVPIEAIYTYITLPCRKCLASNQVNREWIFTVRSWTSFETNTSYTRQNVFGIIFNKISV